MNKHQIKIILLNAVIFFNISALHADTGIDDVWMALKPDDLTIVQNGRAIYEAQCAACHGVELQGQPNWETPDASGRLPAPPHDKTGHTWHHSDDLLFEITKYGPAKAAEKPDYLSNMPAYEQILGDDEIVAVLSYIKSTWPKREREWQDGLNGAQKREPNSSGAKSLLDKLTSVTPTGNRMASSGHTTATAVVESDEQPLAVVNDFAAALSRGDMGQIKALVASDAIIFEEGSVEWSFAEYERNHLPHDIKFMRRVERTVKDQQEIRQGPLAIVLTQAELKGKNASIIHMAMLETMILKQSSTGWKIVHIHWSSKVL